MMNEKKFDILEEVSKRIDEVLSNPNASNDDLRQTLVASANMLCHLMDELEEYFIITSRQYEASMN